LKAVISLLYLSIFPFKKGHCEQPSFSVFRRENKGGMEGGTGKISQGFNVSRLPSRGGAIITSVTQKIYIV